MSLLNLLYKSENERNKSENECEDFVSRNFARIVEELSDAKKKCSDDGCADGDIDQATGLQMHRMNVGLENFDSSCTELDISNKNDTLGNFACNGRVLLMKFKRKNIKNMMPISEIEKYIHISEEGKIVFLRRVKPETICKIAKSLNNEFYFIVNSLDNVIPLSPAQASAIFKKKQNFKLNSRQHVENVFNSAGKIQRAGDFRSKFHDWFGKNVRHPHPYAYSDMVITERVKNYRFIKKRPDGSHYIIKSQFSNELTGKNLTIENINSLKGFAEKCEKTFSSVSKNKEGHIFAMPCPLYSKKHMLSLVIAFKPNGEINATIVNANGDTNARQKYAVHLCKIFQLAFEKYAPNVSSRVNYFFHENNSQFGGTCMTHADCITKRLAKVPDFKYDGHDLHPIKILQKAYMRAVPVTMYQQAKDQGMFFAEDENVIKNIEKKRLDKRNIDINTDTINDLKKDKINDGSKGNDIKNLINTSKFSRDRFRKLQHNEKRFD